MFAVVNLVKPWQTFSRHSPKPIITLLDEEIKLDYLSFNLQTREQELGDSKWLLMSTNYSVFTNGLRPEHQQVEGKRLSRAWEMYFYILSWILVLDLIIILSQAGGLPTQTWEFGVIHHWSSGGMREKHPVVRDRNLCLSCFSLSAWDCAMCWSSPSSPCYKADTHKCFFK